MIEHDTIHEDVPATVDGLIAAALDARARDRDAPLAVEDPSTVLLRDATRATPRSPLDVVVAVVVIDRGIELLESSEAAERGLAARMLSATQLQESRVVEAISAGLRIERHPDVAVSFVRALGELGDSSALPDLAGLVDHDDDDVRHAAASAIAACAVPDITEQPLAALLELSDDDEADVRLAAIRELARWWRDEGFHDDRISDLLLAGLSSIDLGVREACSQALRSRDVETDAEDDDELEVEDRG